MSPGEVAFKLAYEISPIYMTGGLATNVPGATVPLISYTEPNMFLSLQASGSELSLDNFFAHFIPLPGSTLINNAVGQYPFANQSVAANAIIFEPLNVSLLMICPARHAGDYRARQAILGALKRTLDTHNLAGGTYTIATPSYLYTDCLFLRMTDASGGETHQAQYRYQLDFLQPLVTSQAAQQSYNNLMSKISSQTELTPNSNGQIPWSSQAWGVGNQASGAAPSIVPPSGTDPGLGFASSSDISPGGAVTTPGFTGAPVVTSAVTPPGVTASNPLNTSQVDIPTGDW